ncbi:hypothetical protein RFI_32603 [Reticulomyxa filosa]|uniref:Uncharacterized protein n=1 Tax=Reticulomyxa filosa TaxID=46433 RepID=X6LT18_RETFI|nr:hypothetical protein RFI_32603 [Reticulomyxa filosa]|eukprot:ETO04794.1 hypothetical protein RFI_32603 [Reticulomyxa filosa]
MMSPMAISLGVDESYQPSIVAVFTALQYLLNMGRVFPSKLLFNNVGNGNGVKEEDSKSKQDQTTTTKTMFAKTSLLRSQENYVVNFLRGGNFAPDELVQEVGDGSSKHNTMRVLEVLIDAERLHFEVLTPLLMFQFEHLIGFFIDKAIGSRTQPIDQEAFGAGLGHGVGIGVGVGGIGGSGGSNGGSNSNGNGNGNSNGNSSSSSSSSSSGGGPHSFYLHAIVNVMYMNTTGHAIDWIESRQHNNDWKIQRPIGTGFLSNVFLYTPRLLFLGLVMIIEPDARTRWNGFLCCASSPTSCMAKTSSTKSTSSNSPLSRP